MVDALPRSPGQRGRDIGCGPGAAARKIVRWLEGGYVLGIDRPASAIAQAMATGCDELTTGRFAFRQAAIDDFTLALGETPFDLAFAVRVGVLDGRHPRQEAAALARIAAAPHPGQPPCPRRR